MKDLEFDCQVVTSVTSDLVSSQDWTSDAENLLQSLARDTAQLLEAVKQHFLRIGKASRNILNLAEEAQESKQAQVFIKQNFSPALRKDLEKGRRLWDYTQQFDVEDDIRFIISNTGFDNGNSILGKLPDTLSKVEFPGVLEDPATKKLNVAASILSELVEITLKEKEGVEKNGVKASDVGRLIKLQSVPDCDRVEFKQDHSTYRAEVLGYCPDADAIKVRIDGSGEEKEIPRGTIALKEQKPPKLHESCLVQGDEIEHYNKCGVLKSLINNDKALVLLLDGRLIEVPKKSVIKGKKGSPIPELLDLLSESGNADKVSLAVEKAIKKTSKTYEKQIDELTTEAGKAWSDGRDSIAAEARAMQPKIPFDMFLSIPVPEKLAIFAAQPDEAKNVILANYVKSLPSVEVEVEKIVDRPVAEIESQVSKVATPPAVEVQTSVVEVLDRPVADIEASATIEPVDHPVVEVKAVEVETSVSEPVAEPESDASITARFASKGLAETLPVAPPPPSIEERLAEAEIHYNQAVDILENKKKELGVEGCSHDSNHVVRSQCVVEAKAVRIANSNLCRVRLEIKALTAPAVVEPEPTPRIEAVFSKEDVELADKLLIKGYREIESLGKRVDHTLVEIEKEFPQLREYLTSSYGQEWLCLYYFKNAAEANEIIRSVISDKKQGDSVLDRAIDCSQELDKLAGYYRSGDKAALEKVDMRLKKIAQLLLTKEEFDAIKARASKPQNQTANQPITQKSSPSKAPQFPSRRLAEDTDEIQGGF